MLIDVAKYQGNIDWAKVKNAGVDEAIIRCYVGGDKGSGVDQKFKQNIEGAIAQGIRVGVYCYSKAKSEAGGRTEAKNTAKAIEPYKDKLYFPVFIDLEQDGTGAYSKKVISGFCKEINALGYNAGIYCSSGWRSSYLRGVNADYWWIADYRGKQPDNCCIWQYSRKGRIDGINADVDLDKNISYYPAPVPIPTPTPKGDIVMVELKVLKLGSTGEEVKTVQRLLREFGVKDQYNKELKVDGNFGSRTEYAVTRYQKWNSECGTPDGKVGEKTWNSLLK